METKNNPSSKKQLNSYIRYSSIGLQMIGSILICAWLGSKIDKYFENETPVATLGMMLLGVASSIYILIRSLNSNK